MAGGMGKRMGSDLPKVLHHVVSPTNLNISYPMLIHVILTSTKLNPSKIFVIVGKFRNIITDTINQYIEMGLISNHDIIEYIDQEEALGTGHAIKCTLPFIQNYLEEKAIILSGDVPLISLNTLNNLNGSNNKLLITELDEPFGCGRIIFNQHNNIEGIVEEKDCNNQEKNIKFVNCGIYQIAVKDLINLIPLIQNNNNSQEYYLTDIVGLMIQNNISIDTYLLDKGFQWEIKNVNTKKDLEELNNFIYMMNK
jgi:bifunctional N-acetylglucosamine-1-phosphate-uridyltransferase/glucosamine-1-phosphate-acetyltransferase GlmU-like protein